MNAWLLLRAQERGIDGRRLRTLARSREVVEALELLVRLRRRREIPTDEEVLQWMTERS